MSPTFQNEPKKGVLVINLGTPNSPQVKDVKDYLKEFLSDPKVLDLPFLIRQILLRLVILPFRSPKSARAYQSIWTNEGSPLKVYTQQICDRLQARLDSKTIKVVMGMRYAEPSLDEAIGQLKDCTHIDVIPLYPQYATSSYGTCVARVMQLLSTPWNTPSIRILPPFYGQPAYIEALANTVQQKVDLSSIEMLLMSYHGLPQRHIHASGCHELKKCEEKGPCPQLAGVETYCYRAQCFETSRLLAKALNLSDHAYCVSFQSRLGRIPWIQPYTDEMLHALRKKGITRLAVVCPSFVVDCLETLEEIGIGLKEEWLKMGGETFHLIPCINAEMANGQDTTGQAQQNAGEFMAPFIDFLKAWIERDKH